jgi:hypothetical protein
MQSGVGGPNGPRGMRFDRWFRYPAGFGSAVVEACLAGLPSGAVIDPFAGAATVGTAAVQRGYEFVGIEAHPAIAELGGLKFAQGVQPANLLALGRRVLEEAGSVSVEDELELIRRAFDDDVLGRLAALREQIRSVPGPEGLFLKWGLLGALRDCSRVKVGWPYQRPGLARIPRMSDPARAFHRRLQWMAEDLSVDRSGWGPGAVVPGDSRTDAAWSRALQGGRPTSLVTSPPYLNNFDYADATRLELYFWGTVRSWQELRLTVRDQMVTASTQQTRKAPAVDAMALLATAVPRTTTRLAPIRDRLAQERAARARGKEYDLLLPMYFADLLAVFVQARRHLAAGAEMRLVIGDSAPYGVYIDTPALLTRLASELGFLVGASTTIRHRGLRWTKNGSRHQQALKEELLVLFAPGEVAAVA